MDLVLSSHPQSPKNSNLRCAVDGGKANHTPQTASLSTQQLVNGREAISIMEFLEKV